MDIGVRGVKNFEDILRNLRLDPIPQTPSKLTLKPFTATLSPSKGSEAPNTTKAYKES